MENSVIMKLVVYLTFCFIAYELLKLFMLKTYWNASLNRRKYRMGTLIEFLYFLYMIYLFFAHYWYIGLCILIVSAITALQLNDDFIEREKFNKSIRRYLIADGVVSIIFLLLIIFKELIL